MAFMFSLYQSNRLEDLAQRLADVMQTGSRSPFVPEAVVTPHAGLGRWLALRLAEGRGVCANVEFPLPGAFIWGLFRRLFPEQIPEVTGFEPEVMVWRIDAFLSALPDADVFHPLRAYLSQADERMRHELAQRISDVFDQYLVYRPDWILAWEQGKRAIEGDDWQAALWRVLTAGGRAQHWVYWQQRFFTGLDEGRLDTGRLPDRVILFAIQTLSPGYLEVLKRVAEHTEVHLFLLNPSEGHWSETVSEAAQARREAEAGGDELYLDVGNPLLSSMGGQGRDFFASILDLDPGSEELFKAPGAETLLGRLQRDILLLSTPEEGARIEPAAICRDPSIQIHACHSPMREVEVLQDRLLDLFERHPGLWPDDVLVMTPDIAVYAPYIEAVFGEPGDRPSIPFQLADRPGLDAAPMVRAFLDLLRMPLGRFEADRPLSVLEVAAVQRRFGLAEDDLPEIIRWVREDAIRWGRDAAHRRRFGREGRDANSWRAGLDRMLLGYAMGDGEGRMFEGWHPYAGVDGGDAAVLGALHEFMERLFTLAGRLEHPRTLDRWVALLLETLDLFFLPEGEEEGQLQTLRDLLATMLNEARAADYQAPVSTQRMLWLLEQRIGQTQGLGGFLRGGVTFSALTPQRSLPFEVICLIGMNDGRFPRERHPPDFDLMQGHRRPGDRSRRADDRYLFLETLLAARRELLISYVGQDIGDNSPRPPSVVVSELIDCLARYAADAKARDEVRNGKVIRHPLQAFDPRCFAAGRSPLAAYSRALARAAQWLTVPGKVSPPPFLDGFLPKPPERWNHPTLTDLEYFFSNPVRFLLRRRMGIDLKGRAALPEVRDPMALGRFEVAEWRRRMVAAMLDGRDPQEVHRWMQGAGVLPDGAWGEALFARYLADAESIVKRIRQYHETVPAERVSVDLRSGDMTLSGELFGIGRHGQFGYSASELWDKDRLRLWLRHLCLNLPVEDKRQPVSRPGSSRVRGNGDTGSVTEEEGRHTVWVHQGGVLHFTPVADAREQLADLLACYREGLARPLPYFPNTSWAYLVARIAGKDAMAAAEGKWFGNHRCPGEWVRDDYYSLVFPGGDVLDAHFEALARRVLEPLHAHMEEG